MFCSLHFAVCYHWLKDLGGWELETPLLVGLVLGDLVHMRILQELALMWGALVQQPPLALFVVLVIAWLAQVVYICDWLINSAVHLKTLYYIVLKINIFLV